MKYLKKIPHAVLIICFSSIIFAQSFTPIGVVNPNNYIPEQKDIAVSPLWNGHNSTLYCYKSW
jgi:Skp family chaperone for outer membrane proteins